MKAFLSNCCGHKPLYDVNEDAAFVIDDNYNLIGICSCCKEHTGFENKETDDE